MYVAYEDDTGLLNIRFRPQVGSAQAKEYPGGRYVEYDERGIVAIEFLHAKEEGIDLEGMPEAEAIAKPLESLASLLSSRVRLPA
jgi:uncharacterized protein YuzE